MHCIAGDATGIVAAAVITSALGLPMWVDLIVEYVAGFGFGLFVFQALFMKDMMGGSYRAALRSAFVPEWLSMNMMAAGMFPVMIFLMMGRDMRAMDPPTPQFWAVMSLGVIVGFFVAYPVNVWMVAKNLKHGLMTARPAPQPSSPPRPSPGARGGPVMTTTDTAPPPARRHQPHADHRARHPRPRGAQRTAHHGDGLRR